MSTLCSSKLAPNSKTFWNSPLTVNGEPQEDTTCLDSTLYLVDPLIIKIHPSWLLADLLARFSALPESRRSKVLISCDGVNAPFAASSVSPQPDGGGQNRASGRCVYVTIASNKEDEWAE
jgi:hypothetical protein